MIKQVLKYSQHPKNYVIHAKDCLKKEQGWLANQQNVKERQRGKRHTIYLINNHQIRKYSLFNKNKKESSIIRTKFKLPTRYSNKYFSVNEVPNRFSEAASTQVVIDTISYFSKESIERINKLFAKNGKNFEQYMEEKVALEALKEPAVGGVTPRQEETIEKDKAAEEKVNAIQNTTLSKPEYSFDIGILTSSGSKDNLESFTQSLFSHWNLSTKRGFLLHITDRNQVILSVGYEFNHDLYEELEAELFHLVNNPRMHSNEKEDALVGLLERFRDADYRWWSAKHSRTINASLLTNHHVFAAFENAKWEKMKKTETGEVEPAKPDSFLTLMTELQTYETTRLNKIKKHNQNQNRFWFISFSVFAALLLLYSIGEKEDKHFRCEKCDANPDAQPSFMVPRDIRHLKSLSVPAGLLTEHKLKASVLEGRICPTCKHEAIYRIKENPRFRDCQRCQFHTVELLPENELFGYCHHCTYRQPLSAYDEPVLADAMKSSNVK